MTSSDPQWEVPPLARFQVLGPVRAIPGGPAGGLRRKQRALLARLLLQPGRAVSTDALIDAVWADEPLPEDPRAALQSQVHRLRRFLGGTGARVVTRPPGYALGIGSGEVDAVLFEQWVADGKARAGDDPRAALDGYDAALSLWRGPAYGEFADTFARVEAARLEQLRTDAREDRTELLLALGRNAEATAAARELCAAHPLRERPRGQLMRALTLSGRQGEAIGVYQDFRLWLRDELGVHPSPELQEIHLRVLRQEVRGTRSADPVPPRAVASRGERRASGPGGPGGGPGGGPPRPLSALVGRAGELRRLDALLTAAPLVTLTGPGGVGKTRLALEYALRQVPVSKVAWVELAELREPEAVIAACCEAVGAETLPPGAVGRETLVRACRDQDLVLLIDNCEHVVDTVARIADAVVRACPGVKVLATSRERLAVEGEHVLGLPPLPVAGPDGTPRDSPALQLFLERLRAAGHPVHPGDTRSAYLAGLLCTRLDGLPLALELAAVRAAALGLEEVAGADDLLSLLDGRRAPGARQTSLRSSLDWSYRLLSAEERSVFRRLAGLPGPFTLDQAQRLCGGGRPPAHAGITPVLAALIDKSLVLREPDGGRGPRIRYRMLSATSSFAARRPAEERLPVPAGH